MKRAVVCLLVLVVAALFVSAQTTTVTCTKITGVSFSCPEIIGPQGLQGPIGPIGLTGSAGLQGPPGTNGSDGAAGAVGATGATGPAGPGVPTGGSIGSVLIKNSTTDFDTRWASGLQSVAATLPQADTAIVTPLVAMSTDVASGLGTSKPIAQQVALKAMVDALVQNGFVPAPASPNTINDYYALALAVADAQNRYTGLQMTGLTRFLATIVMNDTDVTTGIVNWTQVQTDINAVVGSWVTLNLITVPNNLTTDQLDSFALGLAQAIQSFNTSVS